MAPAKILIVEDEALIARDIELSLENLGYEVVGIAADGASAIKKVSETHPDLILMDIILRGADDGITVTQKIQEQYQVPVVYLTAYADEATLERVKTTQSFGYILKPFEERNLRVTIDLALSRWQQQVQAQSKSALHSEHLAILSHELRNPLSAIRISASLLNNDQYVLNESMKQRHIQSIQAATDVINQLLEDVLTLGQTEQPLRQSMPVPVNLVTFCEELVTSTQLGIGENHQIYFHHDPDQIAANIDSNLLWHLLTNLLSNAIKYSPPGGTVTLRLSANDGFICMSVTDEGIGIPIEDQQNLFQPFRRGSNVGKLPGTGLGLAIAKRVADLHGGTIEVTSEVGKGSTFTVWIPWQEVTLAEPHQAGNQPAGNAQSGLHNGHK